MLGPAFWRHRTPAWDGTGTACKLTWRRYNPFFLTRVIFVEKCFQSENFTAPSSSQKAVGANSVAADHGKGGPVQVSFPTAMFGGTEQISFVNATKNLFNITHCPDLCAGAANCVALVPLVRTYFLSPGYVVLNVLLEH